MHHDNMFSVPIFSFDGELDTEYIKSACYYQRQVNPGKIASNAGGWQSENLDFDLPFLHRSNLLERIAQAAREYAEVCRFKYKDIRIHLIWVNINGKNCSNTVHTHPGCHVSGVYYVKCPEKCGNIIFLHPCTQLILREYNLHELGTEVCYAVKPKEDKLVLFPSWIEHQVGPNLSDEDRISISFNVSFLL